MTTNERIIEVLKNLSESELLTVYNSYCDDNNKVDDIIYSMWDFEEILNGIDKFELVRMALYGEFNPNDDYFYFNGYGNLNSCNFIPYEIYDKFDTIYSTQIVNDQIVLDEVADYIVNSGCDYGITEIEEILESLEV